VTDAERAFGTDKDLPKWEEIPEDFKGLASDNKFVALFSHLFYHGGHGVSMKLKDGVDGKKLVRWFEAHVRTWGPKHEHKSAGVAWRLSQWIDDWSLQRDQNNAPMR